MTAQISDTVVYKSENYVLIGVKASGLFHPLRVGIRPEMFSTACYQGFYCTYELNEGAMYLQELYVYDSSNQYPPINGVSAEPIIENVTSQDEDGQWRTREEICDPERHYSNLNLPVPCTGKLRIAREMIPELYVHMGFQKASAFKHVLDITLFNGTVAGVNDRSVEMERIRGQFKDAYESGDIMQTIEDAFSLDIKLE